MRFFEVQAGMYFNFKEIEVKDTPKSAPICIKTKDGGYTILSGSMIGAHFIQSNYNNYKKVICLELEMGK